ncbi:MAG: glycosyltransferase family 2 protein [Candidatus Pacebacteria bacterium]|jgi:(heptosyl)LPS beta-1,4-glucosyltransferase|nr:glycosyltransferase family 2 protein [Candidatus Paceibacterota bacterium]MBT6756030.1 glycosyltransferase family 2 protein [Candidatus Paceibacterota bacterium]MBT6920882.1 glycosyltransferase family 2 protein [Candidatus Paceibacterota bacterium]
MDKKKMKISAIILAKDESSMIEGCINSLDWCDEILLVDNGSSDDTVIKAENLGARVISFSHPSFARKRNEGLKHATGDWIFYIDADERVTPTFAKEILVHIETGEATVLESQRKNYCYGFPFSYGGWQDDFVTRIFKKESLKEWTGKIHESPVYEGTVVKLHSSLIHLTHRSTEDNLRKSADWTKLEADLLYKAGEKPVNLFTLVRKGVMEFFRRVVLKKGYKDGMPGVIEGVVQGINRMIIYIQVWELQQKPSLSDRYSKKETEIKNLWKKEKNI